jgi:hypothetical protein
MLDIIKDIITLLILAGVCAIGAWLLRSQKRQILATVTDLIQKAEQAVQGTGLGAEKKALVTAQLEAMGIKVNDWMNAEIDNIVAWLNMKGAWYAATAGSTISNTVK